MHKEGFSLLAESWGVLNPAWACFRLPVHGSAGQDKDLPWLLCSEVLVWPLFSKFAFTDTTLMLHSAAWKSQGSGAAGTFHVFLPWVGGGGWIFTHRWADPVRRLRNGGHCLFFVPLDIKAVPYKPFCNLIWRTCFVCGLGTLLVKGRVTHELIPHLLSLSW